MTVPLLWIYTANDLRPPGMLNVNSSRRKVLHP